MRVRQAAAIGALLFGFAGLAVAIVVAVQEFPRGPIALACVALGAAGARPKLPAASVPGLAVRLVWGRVRGGGLVAT
jgi:hypothetical protein